MLLGNFIEPILSRKIDCIFLLDNIVFMYGIRFAFRKGWMTSPSCKESNLPLLPFNFRACIGVNGEGTDTCLPGKCYLNNRTVPDIRSITAIPLP